MDLSGVSYDLKPPPVGGEQLAVPGMSKPFIHQDDDPPVCLGADDPVGCLQDAVEPRILICIGKPTAMLAIHRDPFLEALTGQPRSRQMAGDVVQERLAADAAATDG